MKILLTGPHVEPFRGGIQTFIRNYLEAFKNNHSIFITFFPITYGLYNNESFFTKICRIFYNIIPFMKAGENCDIIHFNSTFDNRSLLRDTFYALLAILILKKKVILQFHGGQPSTLALFCNALPKRILNYCFSHVEVIIVLSQLQLNQFRNSFPEIDKIEVIPNFIKKVNLPEKRQVATLPTFLFLSRLDEEKGVKEILFAARSLKDSNENFKIYFCGDGILRDWLIENINIMELSQFVFYKGIVTGEDKCKILADSDIMLLPTRHNEGFPFVILEAFMSYLPVISSPAGAIPEIVEDGKSGFLVPSTDYHALTEKIVYFCQNPQEIITMGSYARSIVEQKYTIQKMISKFTRIYSCINRGRY